MRQPDKEVISETITLQLSGVAQTKRQTHKDKSLIALAFVFIVLWVAILRVNSFFATTSSALLSKKSRSALKYVKRPKCYLAQADYE